MKERTITFLLMVLVLMSGSGAAARECDTLRKATAGELVTYLNEKSPDERNADCMTLAIKRLEKERYGPAIAVLTKLLDFRRPPNEREKRGLYLRPQVIEEIYPTANALEEIGNESLPAILGSLGNCLALREPEKTLSLSGWKSTSTNPQRG